MPTWVALLLAFWTGSLIGFGLAIIVMSRFNSALRKRESDNDL